MPVQKIKAHFNSKNWKKLVNKHDTLIILYQSKLDFNYARDMLCKTIREQKSSHKSSSQQMDNQTLLQTYSP